MVAFWQYALSQPSELAHKVDSYFPLTKADFYRLQKNLSRLDGIDLAAAFYVLNRASFSGATMSGGMSPGHKRFTPSSIDRLRHFYAPNVSVTGGCAFEVLERLGSEDPSQAVVYLDPPYKLDDSVLYGTHGSTHKTFDHERLAHACQTLSDQGHRFVISYNDAPKIRELYPTLRMESASWAYGMKNVAGTEMGKSSEILIFSKACAR